MQGSDEGQGEELAFGLLANRYRYQNLEHCRRTLLGLAPLEPRPAEGSFEERCQRLTGVDPSLCPTCREGRLVLQATIPRPCYSSLRTRSRRSEMLPSQSHLGPRAPPCPVSPA